MMKKTINRMATGALALLLCLLLTVPAFAAESEVRGTGDMTLTPLRLYWEETLGGWPEYLGCIATVAVASEGYDPSDDGGEDIPVVDSTVTYYLDVALVEGGDVEAAKAEILSLLSPDHVIQFTRSKYSLRKLEEIAAYLTATYGKEACVTKADTVEVTIGPVNEETDLIRSRMAQDESIPSDVQVICVVWNEDYDDIGPWEEEDVALPELDVELAYAHDGAPMVLLIVLGVLALGVGATLMGVSRRKAVLQTAAGVNVLQEQDESTKPSRAALEKRLSCEGCVPGADVDIRIRERLEGDEQ